ncbi:hypothetical protein LLE49_28000 [Alicyclobacillus tolerans]|uniref:hypothetical protein n=1 Tax=Alicyclobacillus tolerans TaxID=90970 RepID=UPI001F1F825D|nr:hypothetical protein [Alicyclobacillus tolerans]MCF8568567.1 hypothetical protein [Alicyclobacillus tolerans]
MNHIEELTVEIDPWINEKLFELLELNEKAKRRGEPVILPFVMTGDSDGENLTAFPLHDYVECVTEAIKYAIDQRQMRQYIILGYDGYLTHDGLRTDALFYKAYQHGTDGWLNFAQRYRPKKLFSPYKRIGSMLFIDATAELDYGSVSSQ